MLGKDSMHACVCVRREEGGRVVGLLDGLTRNLCKEGEFEVEEAKCCNRAKRCKRIVGALMARVDTPGCDRMSGIGRVGWNVTCCVEPEYGVDLSSGQWNVEGRVKFDKWNLTLTKGGFSQTG